MEKKRKILHIIDNLNFGGAQKLLALLVKWSPRDRYETIICALQPGSELVEEIEAAGSRVVCFDRVRPSILHPHRFLLYIYQNLRDIAQLCRLECISIVHCHLSDAEFVGVPAAWLSGVDLVLVVNHYPFLPAGRSPYDPRNLARHLTTRILYNKLANIVVAVSEDIARRLVAEFGTKPEKIRTILNGIDVKSLNRNGAPNGFRESLGLCGNDKILATIERLSYEKGHLFLIEAMASLVREFPNIKLLVIGEGDLREELMRRCAVLGLSNHILFLGGRKDIPEILAASDIFVLPSLYEGTSVALIEAMAASKPIIATDVRGNSAVLRHLVDGFLVPPGNPSDLANAVSFLLNNPERASTLARHALRKATEQFDIRRTVSQLDDIWSSQPPLSTRRMVAA